MNDSPATDRHALDAAHWWQRPRWRYAAGAFLLGVAYTAFALAIGAVFRVGGRDLTLIAGAVVEVSFGLFGFLLGLAVEARRRDRAAAAERQAHQGALADAQRRLAQAEKLASLGQLAGAIAHEVRNPLAILRSMVQNLEELLPREAPAQAAKATCAALLEEIDRLAHVTSSLVDFARPPAFVPGPIVAAELIQRVGHLAEQMLRSASVDLEVTVPPHPGPMIQGDADLLSQVLLGLLENAAASAPEGSTVRLASRFEDRAVVFEVMDQGSGVAEPLRERIFEPFFTTRPGGAGLGLAVAKHIVEAHGGRVAVDEGPGGGARFRVCLPTMAPGDPAKDKDIATRSAA